MSEERSPAEIVDEALSELVSCLRDRDFARGLGLFSDDAALFGSAAGESALGHDALKAFFASVFDLPFTVGWSWTDPVAGRQGDVVWFVCLATLEPRGDDAPEDRPYRLSGVLRRSSSGDWVFELFNGAEPAAE